MTSTVTCGYSGAAWEVNSSGQNACQVYAAIAGHCNPSFTIGDATPSSPPYAPQNNQCTCNLVAYNLQAACGWCQSAIQSSWWLTESEWAGNCTTSTYDASGIPSSVASGVNIPNWAYLSNIGDSWSPSIASAAALTAGGSNPTAIPTNNGFSYSYNPYTYSYYNGNDPYYNWNYYYGAGVAAWAIAVGVMAGIYALMGLTIGIVYWMRQKKRKAWYGPMAQYYRQRGVGGYQGNYATGGAYQPPFNPGGGPGGHYDPNAGGPAAVPLLYQNEHNTGTPHTKHASLYSSSPAPTNSGYGGQYQPPPPETNPFTTPYPTPGGTGYQPPPAGEFGAPPQGPPPGAGGAGYRGHAEVY